MIGSVLKLLQQKNDECNTMIQQLSVTSDGDTATQTTQAADSEQERYVSRVLLGVIRPCLILHVRERKKQLAAQRKQQLLAHFAAQQKAFVGMGGGGAVGEEDEEEEISTSQYKELQLELPGHLHTTHHAHYTHNHM